MTVRTRNSSAPGRNGDRRNQPRSTKERRQGSIARTPGKFKDAVDTAFRVMRKNGIAEPFEMTTPVARLSGELYVPNLANRLGYHGYQFGDEIRLQVELVKRPKQQPKSVFEVKWPKR